MNSSDWEALAARVERMLRKFGAPATLIRRAVNSDIGDDGRVSLSQSNEGIVVVGFDYPEDFINDTRVREGDIRIYAAARGVEPPKAGDGIIWGGVEKQVISVKALRPALINVLYELQVRSS